jgi:tight adherence protein B
MNIFVIGIIIFVIAVCIIEVIMYTYGASGKSKRQEIKKRLKTLSSTQDWNSGDNVLKKEVLSNTPLVDKILGYLPGTQPLNRFLLQANAPYTLDVLILMSSALALTAYVVCSLLLTNTAAPIIAAVVFGAGPFLNLSLKKKQRMDKFQRQLPDALDLIGRALRAGHAFTSGMKLAADEFQDPLGPEFSTVLDEINFGISVHDALMNLVNRVDCPDLKYFVISVILQRETGGNLAEIIESIAHLIRERFKLKGKIRVLAAEGKFTAMILFALPFFVIISLRLTNPKYINSLFNEPEGQLIGAIALVMMIIGAIMMKKMVNIKV